MTGVLSTIIPANRLGRFTRPDVTHVAKRMSYPLVEASLNGEHYRTAMDKVGGRHSKGVKNWWDMY